MNELAGAYFATGSVWEVDFCCCHEASEEFSTVVRRLLPGVVHLGFDG